MTNVEVHENLNWAKRHSVIFWTPKTTDEIIRRHKNRIVMAINVVMNLTSLSILQSENPPTSMEVVREIKSCGFGVADFFRERNKKEECEAFTRATDSLVESWRDLCIQ